MKTIVAAFLLLTAGAATAQAPLKFPKASHAWLPEGLFVPMDTIRQVKLGMTKAQVRALLGPPHFSEGFGSRGWSYLINFRSGQGLEFTTCQMKLEFDGGRIARAAWKDPTCGERLVVTVPVAAAAVAPEIITRVVKEPADIVIKQFAVLFPFNGDKLTSEGRAIVEEATNSARSEQARKTTVVGSADRAGSPAYNLGLADRRAKAVAAALTAGGVSLVEAVVSSTGEDQPAVPTADGVREAANRRVIITLIR